ncbi:MAG TPA: fumarylacetoacetase [Terriglobales bacterium]|nr:fumarylacetoacetase [Terriglobales bacterium]
MSCWIASARSAETDFPLHNLPYGALAAAGGEVHLGVAIGEEILDLRALRERGGLDPLPEAVRQACGAPLLNPLLELGPEAASRLRRHLTGLLSGEAGREATAGALRPQAGAELRLPMAVGDYTDFYASRHHARNVGAQFRPDHPLLPNYDYVPVGYHGRSSSLVASPAAVRRPNGQRPSPGSTGAPPTFGPSLQLDYEVEVGVVVGQGNRLGEPIPLGAAEGHIFGLCLLNDWSARDLQRWEYQPLGPFLGKNFATSLSPWVVTLEALAPFRLPRPEREAGAPAPLAYLDAPADRAAGGLDMTVEAWLSSRAMREQELEAVRLSRSNLRDLYWTLGQMLTHHASNGCNLRPGDVLGTGTLSGPGPEARGCLLELTQGGKGPLVLPSGEHRGYLEDDDEVTLRGWCERAGVGRLGWGECRGRILPAPEM